jgi:hypothetical protein
MSIDLQRFCATEADPREHLRAPWKHGDFVYATDGNAAVRVPAQSRPDITDAPASAPNAASLFYKAFEADGEFLLMPPVPPVRTCLDCEGHGKVRAIKCPDCDEGTFTHGHYTYECKNCEDSPAGRGWEHIDNEEPKQRHEVQRCCDVCDGRGYLVGGESMTLGDALYDPAYLALFAALPQVRVRPGSAADRKPSTEPAAFIFDGGQGLLMPTRY